MKNIIKNLTILTAFAGFGSTLTSCGEKPPELTVEEQKQANALRLAAGSDLALMEAQLDAIGVRMLDEKEQEIRSKGEDFSFFEDSKMIQPALQDSFDVKISDFNKQYPGVVVKRSPQSYEFNKLSATTIINGKEILIFPYSEDEVEASKQEITPQEQKQVDSIMNTVGPDIAKIDASVNAAKMNEESMDEFDLASSPAPNDTFAVKLSEFNKQHPTIVLRRCGGITGQELKAVTIINNKYKQIYPLD